MLSQLSVQDVSLDTESIRLLVVAAHDERLPAVEAILQKRNVVVLRVDSLREARDTEHLTAADAVLVSPAHVIEDVRNMTERQLLADALSSNQLTAILLSPDTSGVVPGNGEAFMTASPEMTEDELWGRLVALKQVRPQLVQMEHQVSAMQKLGKKLNEHFTEVDQELRLASRLQRDFLPKALPESDEIRFAVLYRPATWVSGDAYNVRRLDETHFEFFLADAIGHGVAAGLLTMFIKQSLIGKRVTANGYSLIPPDEVLARLNEDLAAQELPNCQFVTGCYGTLDLESYRLTFARGGHPHPIHVSANGQCREIRTVGGLLGVFEDEEFPSVTTRLEPGEKLFIYSDGLEDMLIGDRDGDTGDVEFRPMLLELVRQSADECVAGLGRAIDQQAGSLTPADDQTCLIIERKPSK